MSWYLHMGFRSQRYEGSPWSHIQGSLCSPLPFGLEVYLGPLLGDLETKTWKETRIRLKRQEL
jgi:hypothetical protein